MASSEFNLSTKKQTVAIVGSGLAGLATAYLLHNDRHQRYAVSIFESGETFSFNSASVSIRDESQRAIEQIDLPMRAFAQGYYANLIRMYQYLGIKCNPQRFIYTFAKASETGSSMAMSAEPAIQGPYFVHTSNHHQIPPIRPKGVPLIPWLLDVIYVAACYFWWSFCCFWVAPYPATQARECESLDEYVQRIKLPRHFMNFYLLPLLASVATCTHTALLQSPARDAIEYKKRSAGGQHFTVSELSQVQQELGAGVRARFSTTIKKIEAIEGSKKVRIVSRATDDDMDREEIFDYVVLAVAPGVVGQIYQRLESAMTQIPSTLVESVVQHHDGMKLSRSASSSATTPLPHTLHFRTSTALAQTESLHVYPSSGAIVTTCPLTDISSSAQHVLKSARFFRGLRTPRSRRIVNEMFGENLNPVTSFSYGDDEKKKLDFWKNGDENVWLAGGWCWDGMVLLEGCVVSAMRVARALDVDVPWARSLD
ncbi:hypothetical protein DM02DRAFT_718204 [Periconia macrospinosa]|uniref:FAD/NAD(P)-binding domain-containing protein n=1 Tax=Periconia macrospinosa TaxID=97972 RepID=A0A2V1DRV5_9PLEO|nr:hypothetical protein DM02DRAFT_718204 [Periconia macrospinosa]